MAEPQSSEQTPLLGNGAPNNDGEHLSPAKKAGRWFARNAVAIFASLLICAIIIILGVFYGVYRAKPVSKANICLTPACVHASSEILYNLSPNYQDIDPCTDFEQLTCGGWTDRHDLRSDQEDAFTGTFMAESSETLLRHILEAPYPKSSKHSTFSPAQLLGTLSSADQDNFNKLKDAYQACIDEDTIKAKGIKPLAEILYQVAEIYPVKASKSNRDDLADAITYLAKIGVTSLISLDAGSDLRNPELVVVQAGPPNEIGLPAKENYQDVKITKKYEDTLVQIIENMTPVDYKGENATTLAHGVVEFEKLLAAASPDAQDLNDVTQTYNPMSLKDAELLVPKIRLSKIIKSLAPSDVEVGRLIVTSPSYLKNISSILSHTSRDSLHTYFIWKVIQEYYSVTEADEIKPYSRFRNELAGKDPDSSPERWRTCVNLINNGYAPSSGLGWILSRFFVEKAFSSKAKEFGDQIVTDIKDMFTEKLKTVDWMDKGTTKLAIEKVHKIVQKIGYPTTSPDIMNPEALRSFYSPVTISASAFFQNALSMNRFGVSEMWSTLGKPVDFQKWEMTVPTVNAYYNPPLNEIVFPAGIMQFPVFDVNLPKFLSYGAFGSVAGHELSHAFDSTGRNFDQNGNYTDWWTNSTVAGFTERADCFVDQYHNYTITGPRGKPLHVNGKLTLGENIADAGGVSAAFAAWRKRQAESRAEDLPGLDYFTQDQLFFVSYASWWCGKSRKESAINRIYTDPHAPKWARILGTMANSKDFRESFKCPSKKPVCELW